LVRKLKGLISVTGQFADINYVSRRILVSLRTSQFTAMYIVELKVYN